MSWGRRQKGICGVQLDNRKVLRALVPRTKYFECLFFCLLLAEVVYKTNLKHYLKNIFFKQVENLSYLLKIQIDMHCRLL